MKVLTVLGIPPSFMLTINFWKRLMECTNKHDTNRKYSTSDSSLSWSTACYMYVVELLKLAL